MILVRVSGRTIEAGSGNPAGHRQVGIMVVPGGPSLTSPTSRPKTNLKVQRTEKNMSGYADDFSKSNNALAAECDGKFPASVLASKLGVKTGAIRELMKPCEWHHTSKHYNSTDYYSSADALEILAKLKAWREPVKDEQTFENCSGSYLEWSGTRNHPHAKEIKFENVRVTKKGKWFTLHLPTGPVRKGEDTRGFHLFNSEKRPLTFNR